MDYTVLRCPYCKYVWSKRGENQPVSCPRCKKRFDYPGNRVVLEEQDVTTDSIRDYLVLANKLSMQSESLEETAERLEKT